MNRGAQPQEEKPCLSPLGGQHLKSIRSVCGSFVWNQRKLFDIRFTDLSRSTWQ